MVVAGTNKAYLQQHQQQNTVVVLIVINKIGTRHVDIITIFVDIVEILTAFVAVVVVVNI